MNQGELNRSLVQAKLYLRQFLLFVPRQLGVIATILLAVPIALIAFHFKAGGLSWFLGGLISGLALYSMNRRRNAALKPNPTVRQVGLILIGAVIGLAITRGNLTDVAARLPIFVFLSLLVLCSASLIGYIYARLSKTDLFTSMLATAPGNMAVMASIAADYGKDAALVTLIQSSRYILTIFLIPLIVRVSSKGRLSTSLPKELIDLSPSSLLLLLLATGSIIVGVYIARRLKLPVAVFFGAMIGGVLFNVVTPVSFTAPPLLNCLGQILLGMSIGEYCGARPRLKWRQLAYTLIPGALILLVGLLTAVLAMSITGWDWSTAVLVTAPGAGQEMILVALALNHNVETVTAGYFVRIVTLHATLPLFITFFRYLDRRLGKPETL